MRGSARAASVCLLAALAVFFASEATAQSRGSRGGQKNTAGEQRPQEIKADQLEQLLEELREDLKLQPGQRRAWDSYIEKVRALALDMARERSRAAEAAKGPALKRIDHLVDVARDRLTALEDIAAAAKTLYDSLSPEQRSAADLRLATLIPAVSPGGASVVAERPGQPRNAQ